MRITGKKYLFVGLLAFAAHAMQNSMPLDKKESDSTSKNEKARTRRAKIELGE